MSIKVDYDAIVVGAGFAGLALIHHLKKIGISVKVFDRATDIGGTWTWNRYPGAATDSEGYYYCLSFSKEIMQEWTWSERYPGSLKCKNKPSTNSLHVKSWTSSTKLMLKHCCCCRENLIGSSCCKNDNINFSSTDFCHF